LWPEIERIRLNRSGTSRIVDGQTESTEKFQHLYTSVPHDVHELQYIQDDVKDLIAEESPHDDCIF
jgi:3-deoxy-D-manno-octulosonate 8-phosphate phosphatase KdsC-like HAD superfamily phosphatase